MRRRVAVVVKTILSKIPKRVVERAVQIGLGALADAASPVEGLRSLFRIENELYGLEGKLARDYGGGEHTKHRHMNYHAFFLKNIEAGDRVVDIGCGDGTVTRDIGGLENVVVLGIDQNAESVHTARCKNKNKNVSFVVGDALHDLPVENYDVVVLSNILEHIERRIDFLRKIVERMCPRTILIRVPMFDRDWRVPLKEEIGVEWRLDSTHQTEYTKESLVTELETAGCMVRQLEIRWGEIWARIEPRAKPARRGI